MALPYNLVLVRHGHSEGNDANQKSRRNDNSAFTDAFLNRHSHTWKLTSRGVKEAKAAAKWLAENINFTFDRFYVSEYDRAKQTAALLDLPNAQWSPKVYLRERDRGEIDVVPDDVLKKIYAEVLRRRQISPFFWRPPEGESLADVVDRVRSFLNTLSREAAGKNVVVVCHGEVIWAFRFVLESMSLQRFNKLDASRSKFEKINNCQILIYTREGKGGMYENYWQMKSICPWDESRSKNRWQKIKRQKYSNEDLLDCLGVN